MDANYVAMIVVLIVWIGIFMYIWSVDKKIDRLEKHNEG